MSLVFLFRLGDNHANEHTQNDNNNDSNDNFKLHVLPPHFPPQLLTSRFELARTILELICPLVDIRQLGIPLDNPLDIVLHDTHNLIDLLLGLVHLVVRPGHVWTTARGNRLVRVSAARHCSCNTAQL